MPGATLSVTCMNGDPPVVKLTTNVRPGFDLSQERTESLRRLVGPSINRIAGMQMHDGGARLGGADSCLPRISLAVTGRLGDIDGVWIEPVTAHVMIILLAFAISHPEKNC